MVTDFDLYESCMSTNDFTLCLLIFAVSGKVLCVVVANVVCVVELSIYRYNTSFVPES